MTDSIPDQCRNRTGQCLRVLLKRVQNKDLANDADVLAAAAQRWMERHEGDANHGL